MKQSKDLQLFPLLAIAIIIMFILFSCSPKLGCPGKDQRNVQRWEAKHQFKA